MGQNEMNPIYQFRNERMSTGNESGEQFLLHTKTIKKIIGKYK